MKNILFLYFVIYEYFYRKRRKYFQEKITLVEYIIKCEKIRKEKIEKNIDWFEFAKSRHKSLVYCKSTK